LKGGPKLAWAIALCAFCACRSHKGPALDPAVIATVNGQTLPRLEFERELTRELEFSEGAPPPTAEQLEPIKKQLLSESIEHALLLQAAKDNNVSVTADEVDRELLRMSSDFPADGFAQALAQSQMSLAELKRETTERLTIRKLFQEHVYPRVGVTEQELRAYYQAHGDELQERESVHAQQIVVKGMDEARRIQAQLRAGKKFSELAQKYSLSADAKVGGDLGFFKRGDMPAEFDEVTFKLAVGQTSEIIPTEYGFHIFRVLERRPAHKLELAQIRNEVERQLLKEKREQAQKDYVGELRKKAQVSVNDPVLQALTGQPQRQEPGGQGQHGS
jgi:peptidyl-prolyl cis-trans isomerase C/foldase protein PrsA